jgi:Protein of unknown function (DUF433)
MKFTRISVNPKQMGGVPRIRGMRIPVAPRAAADDPAVTNSREALQGDHIRKSRATQSKPPSGRSCSLTWRP